jgi:hypothetical protein
MSRRGAASVKSDKSIQEEARYNAGLAAMYSNNYLVEFSITETQPFTRHVSNALTCYILESIKDRKDAMKGSVLYADPFPEDSFINLDEFLNPTSKKKKPVSTTSDVKKTKEKPKVKIPKKAEIVQHESDDDEPHGQPEDNTDNEATENEEEKTASKKTIARMTSSAKYALMYVVNRMIAEVFYTKLGMNLTSEEEYVKFMMNYDADEAVAKFNGYVHRVIIPTVVQYGHLVNNVDDHNLTTYLGNIIKDITKAAGDKRKVLFDITRDYIVTYIKLLGYQIGRSLWFKHQSITDTTIVEAMDSLNVLGESFLSSNGVSKPYRSINSGIIDEIRLVVRTLIPPAPPRKPKSDKGDDDEKPKRKTIKSKEEPKKANGKSKKEVSESSESESDEEPEEPKEEPKKAVRKPVARKLKVEDDDE